MRKFRRCRRSRRRPARPAATRCSASHTALSRANARRRPLLPLHLTGSTLRLKAVLSSHSLETVLLTHCQQTRLSRMHLRPKRPARQPRQPRPARRTLRGGRRRRERRTRARRAGSCRRRGARHTPQNNIKACLQLFNARFAQSTSFVAKHARHKIDARAAPNPGAPAQPRAGDARGRPHRSSAPSLSPGFLSGWCCSAARRYAFLTCR